MKKMRRFAGLLLAMVMVMSMAVSTFAATVTVNESDLIKDHTFTAYQIFKGTQSEDKILGDVNWGDGINPDSFLAALKADKSFGVGDNNVFASCGSAAELAKELANYPDFADKVAKIALNNITDKSTILAAGTNELAPGYYLIVDTTNTSGQDKVQNAALLQVTTNINIGLKTDQPSVEKKVWENDKYTGTDYGSGFNDVADHEMGDKVPFKLIGTVPDMTYYDTYQYIFHDTLSSGLTLLDDSVEVFVSNSKVVTTDSKKLSAGTDYSFVETENGFEVVFANLKEVNLKIGDQTGKYIIVQYKATLNQNAVVGLDGNPNKVYLEYSNNPDQSGSGIPGSNDDDHETGKTPEDVVIVFTYELDVTKVDGKDQNKVLENAEFVLYRDSDKLFATVNEDGKITGWVAEQKDATPLKSNAQGIFKVIGLDDGIYWLKETVAPAGYNLLTEDIKLDIQATTANNQNWAGTPSAALTALKLDVTVNNETTSSNGNPTTGIVSTNVVNNIGATLPETGGMGTTIFYVIGATLAIGAAVVMVTRKRMSEN